MDMLFIFSADKFDLCNQPLIFFFQMGIHPFYGCYGNPRKNLLDPSLHIWGQRKRFAGTLLTLYNNLPDQYLVTLTGVFV